ncbi:MAG TPA: PRC-barrel domain-containing protein [bacterium]|jgi:sporulation protein YlmC with PRC-barrel domain
MNHDYHKSLVAVMITALAAAPGWAIAAQEHTRGGESQLQTGEGMYEQQTQPGTAVPSAGVYGKTPKELHRMDVLGTTGDEVGTLKDVVAKREGGEICAVISVGGILGVGAKEIAVPLDELRLEGDDLHILATKDDLMSREIYVADQYSEVQPEDRPISEFSAFEEIPGGTSD